MTTTLGEPAPSTATVRRQPLALCALVACVVVIGAIAYVHWGFFRLDEKIVNRRLVLSRWWLVNLVYALLLFVPYAVVLLLWGRTRTRRVAGAVVALATAGYLWGQYEVFLNYVWPDDGSSSPWESVYFWANTLVLPALIALAWGVARRWGRIWLVGLLVAPALSAAFHELFVHSAWWQTQTHHWLVAEQVSGLPHIAPAVAAAVVCWLIEAAATRRTRA